MAFLCGFLQNELVGKICNFFKGVRVVFEQEKLMSCDEVKSLLLPIWRE